MRKQPTNSPPAVTVQRDESIITQVRTYELITPLYGGGAEAGKPDLDMPIRGTAIRGHLRFWWRACRGGQFNGDLVAMKKAEDALWGAAHTTPDEADKEKAQEKKEPTVQISVEMSKTGELVKPFRIEKDKRGKNQSKPVQGIPPYAAFPLLPEKEELEKPVPFVQDVLDGVSFRVRISFPENRQTDVEAALWAWETFGGIGARTRRGFGALRLVAIGDKNNDNLPSFNAVGTWFSENFKKYLHDGKPPEGIPHISSKMQFHAMLPYKNGKVAWEKLIEKLSHFRQIPDGRDGRSNWPEPEAIREIVKRRYFKYSARPGSRKFPRAEFGLPIIFHFKDTGDPGDTTLQGVQDEENHIDRLASPLILRPLFCKDNQYVGLAVVLEGPRTPPGGLRLVEKDRPSALHIVESKLTKKEAQTIEVLRGEPDVLKAFLNYLGGNNR